LSAHRRALDVPAGPARAPGTLPRGLAGLGGFPQREVERLALLLSGRDALPGAQVVEVALRELGVLRVLRDLKVDVALRLVRDVGANEPFDRRDDLGDVLADLGRSVGLDEL